MHQYCGCMWWVYLSLKSVSFPPESLFESSSVWTTSHSLRSCLTLHLAYRVCRQSMPTTKDKNSCTGQSRYPAESGGAQSRVWQLCSLRFVSGVFSWQHTLGLAVKVIFWGKKWGRTRRIERENLPSSQLGITVMESQMSALLRCSPQCSRYRC